MVDVKALLQENEKLRYLAYVDNLTGCFNRNWIEEYKDSFEYILVVIDINNLKSINDLYGHLVGDKHIKDIADKLKSFGQVARYGGDEFILFLEKSKLNWVSKLKDTRYSFGYSIKTNAESFENALKIADNYMYKKKIIAHKTVRITDITE